jgi:hypothetical protein
MHEQLGRATDPASWMSRKLRELGDTLAAFRTDLGAAFGRVLVVTMSEFGRRVQENSSGGVDHGRLLAELVRVRLRNDRLDDVFPGATDLSALGVAARGGRPATAARSGSGGRGGVGEVTPFACPVGEVP